MKIRPIDPDIYRNGNSYEEYANSLGINPEELQDLSDIYILPKDYKTRIKYSERYNAMEEFYDDLYDSQVELDFRRDNRVRQFTEKISINEMDELTQEELEAYHQFLIDYGKECPSEIE